MNRRTLGTANTSWRK